MVPKQGSELAVSMGWCSTTRIRDVGKDTAEQVLGHRYLGHLEGGVASMGDELRADLHEFVADILPAVLMDRLMQALPERFEI